MKTIKVSPTEFTLITCKAVEQNIQVQIRDEHTIDLPEPIPHDFKSYIRGVMRKPS